MIINVEIIILSSQFIKPAKYEEITQQKYHEILNLAVKADSNFGTSAGYETFTYVHSTGPFESIV